MKSVKATIKMFSLWPSKKGSDYEPITDDADPWRQEVEVRMKLNSESWYYRAKNRRNFTVYDDQEEINLLELANLEPSSEKVSIIFGSLYVNTNSKVLHIYCGTSMFHNSVWFWCKS